MTLQEIINLAQSLTDTTFDNAKWVPWINSAINAVAGAVINGFKRIAVLDVTSKEVTIPTYMNSVNAVYYSPDSTTWYKCQGFPSPDIEGDTGYCYYMLDGKINLSWAASSGKIKLYGECSPAMMQATDLTKVPEFIIPEFHDMLSLYAAALANLADDETERYKEQMKLYNTRFNIYARKMDEVAKPPSRDLQMKSIRYMR